MITTEITRTGTCRLQLKIKISADEMESIREEQIKVVQKEADIKGFRKGRAPRPMILTRYADVIEKYTIDEALQHGFEKSARENKILPFTPPQVKNFKYDDAKNFDLEVEVETYPEVSLKKYKDLELEKEVYKITDEDVEDQIMLLRQDKAVVAPVEGKSQHGHHMVIDMQELDESGMPLVGKKYSDIRIKLGDGKFDPDLEEQMLDLAVHDEKFIEKKYPERGLKKFISSKKERYQVLVKKLENIELPELTDDFVKNLNLGIETVDQLRENVREQLARHWGQESEQHFYNHLVHELLQQNPFDIPESMVDDYLDKIMAEIKRKDEKVDSDETRKNYRTDALFNIKWFYLQESIARAENLQVSEPDYEEFVNKIKEEKLQKFYRDNKEIKRRVLNDLFEKKVFDFIVSNSKTTETEKSVRNRKDLEVV
jgi:trigger factor